MTFDVDDLRRVLDAIDADEPPALEVAERLADATGRSVDATQGEVYDALDAGVLVEEGDGWGGVRLAETYREAESEGGESGETPNTDERKAEEPETSGANPTPNATRDGSLDGERDGWNDVDFTTITPDTYPPVLLEREQWMGHVEKKPFAPWGDADPEDADDSDSPRWEWGREENYLDGEDVSLAEDDPRLDGRVFLQQDSDPFAFVDGDDVRDPETDEVHPAFVALLKHLGVTYADVSTSGSGVHAYYMGELPIEGKGQATFQIDTDPWGANDDPPTVEIYANKHVCVATGDQVEGAPLGVAEWDEDVLRTVLKANGYEDKEPIDHDTDRDRDELEDYEPDATAGDDTTDEVRDVLAAVDRLRPSDLPLRTRQVDSDGTGWEKWDPSTYRQSSGNDSLHTPDRRKFHDHKKGESFGVLKLFALERGIISRPSERLAGAEWWEAVETAREGGAPIPEYVGDDTDEEYRPDPREVEATVDPRRAWDAAGRVTPQDLDTDDLPTTADSEAFACRECGEAVDVVRAAAIDSGLVETCDATLEAEYPEAYRRAREAYGAPLPEYYTEADAIAAFDALLDVIAEVGFFDLDTDALDSEITQRDDEVGGDAVRALDPAWRDSDSGASVLVFPSGTVWDADTERVLDALRFVALDSGLIDTPGEPVEGSAFTEAYRRLREEYAAPVPRWDPAADGSREVTPQLPPSEDLVDEVDLSGVAPDALETAREEVEALLGDATAEADTPTVVTALPATGKTTGAVKTARERPLSYLAPRKELQKQALEKAQRWGVDARVCPVFSEERVDEEVLAAAVSHVREVGKSRLRDRWAILDAAFDDLEGDEAPELGDIFEEGDDEDVALDRPTCETAEGDHGVAWALAVHVARRLGYTPQEIHTEAEGLFGARLPCTCEGECEYAEGWDHVADADDTADLLVGSYVHGHVESVRTEYTRAPDDRVEKAPRAVVLDEYPGEAFVSEYGEEALDFSTWLAGCLRPDVDDRRDMFDADLFGDDWVRAWLDGSGDEVDGVREAIDALGRVADLGEARYGAREIIADVDHGLLEDLGLATPLRRVRDSDTDPAEAFDELVRAIGDVSSEHPAYGVARWVDDDVREPLDRATVAGEAAPQLDAAEADLPIGGDLAELVDSAVEGARTPGDADQSRLAAAVTALRGGREGCRRLAAWAEDGYAHPDAHHLLTGVITPTGPDSDVAGARRVDTDAWAFDPDATEGTVVDRVPTTERGTVVVDRNDHGARLHTPPSRTAGNGDEAPLVGLDATGRRSLWATALGEGVRLADIHDTPAERAAFLEDALDLRVIQAADRPRPYEGDPTTKDTDGDVALLEALADEYAGLESPRQRGAEPVPVGNPAVVTTKQVREVLEADPRLDGVVSDYENYGNLTGANDLGDHRLAAILGSQHYGDHAIERFCALAGREVDTSRDTGRGAALEYGDELANTYLEHMREDQTMQAILRFSRGDSGATVVARTSALREDLPVVGDAQVVETWSDTAAAVARAYRRLGREFTIADVQDAVDVGPRQVRRVLGELAEAGYLERVDSGPGIATTFDQVGEPGAGEVDLEERDQAVDATSEPGRSAHNQYYTWIVRVRGGDSRHGTSEAGPPGADRRAPPAPSAVDGVEPPG